MTGRRVAVTGVGVVAPGGNGAKALGRCWWTDAPRPGASPVSMRRRSAPRSRPSATSTRASGARRPARPGGWTSTCSTRWSRPERQLPDRSGHALPRADFGDSRDARVVGEEPQGAPLVVGENRGRCPGFRGWLLGCRDGRVWWFAEAAAWPAAAAVFAAFSLCSRVRRRRFRARRHAPRGRRPGSFPR